MSDDTDDTITPDTEIAFKWTVEIEHEFSGEVSGLPDELRDKVLGLPRDDDNALHELLQANKDLLANGNMPSDVTDQRVDSIDDAYIYL